MTIDSTLLSIFGKEDETFMDTNCVFKFQNVRIESGGAWIGKDKNGKYSGMLYVHEEEKFVTNWHGTIRIPCQLGKSFYSNMGDRRRAVWFNWKNARMYGVLCNANFNQSVNVRQIKEI